MTNQVKPMTVLDVSKGLGYGFLYNPVIGKLPVLRYPLMVSLRRRYRSQK